MTRPAFQRGDIVRVSLNPSIGHEQQGAFRSCLVLSPAPFNKLGTAFVAPITQGGPFARVRGFAVSLTESGTQTQGVVMVNAVRALDLHRRGARRVERAPEDVVDDVLARLAAIFA